LNGIRCESYFRGHGQTDEIKNAFIFADIIVRDNQNRPFFCGGKVGKWEGCQNYISLFDVDHNLSQMSSSGSFQILEKASSE